MLNLQILLSYAPLAAAVLAAGCAVWAAVGLCSASAKCDVAFQDVAAEISPVDQSLANAAALQGRREQAAAQRDVAPRYAAPNPPGPLDLPASASALPSSAPELSPLELERQEWNGWLELFEHRLTQWGKLAAAPSSFMDDLLRHVHQTRAALANAAGAQQMEATLRQITPLKEETMRTLIAKNDHDLDPQQLNPRLRSLVSELVGLYGFDLIDPPKGTHADSRLHRRGAILPAPSPAARGTIALVRTRGLRNSEGDVLSPAEIIEFD